MATSFELMQHIPSGERFIVEYESEQSDKIIGVSDALTQEEVQAYFTGEYLGFTCHEENAEWGNEQLFRTVSQSELGLRDAPLQGKVK